MLELLEPEVEAVTQSLIDSSKIVECYGGPKDGELIDLSEWGNVISVYQYSNDKYKYFKGYTIDRFNLHDWVGYVIDNDITHVAVYKYGKKRNRYRYWDCGLISKDCPPKIPTNPSSELMIDEYGN